MGLAALGRLGFGGALYALTAVAYLVSVSGTGYLKAIRFLLPVLPLLSVLAGACIERVLPAAARGRFWVWLAVVLVFAAAPLRRSLDYMAALGRPSTNALVRDWMRREVPSDAVVFLGPFFTDDFHRLPYRFRFLSNVGPRQYRLPPGVGLNPERNPIYTRELADALRQAGVTYAVLNSYFDGAFARVPENERFFPHSVYNYEVFIAHLAEEADLVHERIGWAEGRLGPDIRVWRLQGSNR